LNYSLRGIFNSVADKKKKAYDLTQVSKIDWLIKIHLGMCFRANIITACLAWVLRLSNHPVE